MAMEAVQIEGGKGKKGDTERLMRGRETPQIDRQEIGNHS